MKSLYPMQKEQLETDTNCALMWALDFTSKWHCCFRVREAHADRLFQKHNACVFSPAERVSYKREIGSCPPWAEFGVQAQKSRATYVKVKCRWWM
jgi:hypothetical protein